MRKRFSRRHSFSLTFQVNHEYDEILRLSFSLGNDKLDFEILLCRRLTDNIYDVSGFKNAQSAIDSSQFQGFKIEWVNFNLLQCAAPMTININTLQCAIEKRFELSLFHCLPDPDNIYIPSLSCLHWFEYSFDQNVCTINTGTTNPTTFIPQTYIPQTYVPQTYIPQTYIPQTLATHTQVHVMIDYNQWIGKYLSIASFETVYISH